MAWLISLIGRWLFKLVLSFLCISLVLVAGYHAKQQWASLAEARKDIATLKNGREQLALQTKALSEHTRDSAARLGKASIAEMDARLATLKREIADRTSRLTEIESNLLLRHLPNNMVEAARLRVELDYLKQEQQHLQFMRDAGNGLAKQQGLCETAAKLQKSAYLTFKLYDDDIRKYSQPPSRLSPYYLYYKDLKHRHETHAEAHLEAVQKLQKCQKLLKEKENLIAQGANFILKTDELDANIRALDQAARQSAADMGQRWMHQFLIEPFWKLAPAALQILLMALITPIAIKAFLYFFLAPLCCRGRGIRLAPTRNALTLPSATRSGVSLALPLHAGQALYVQPDYLQSDSSACNVSSALALPCCGIFTSWAAGMRNISVVRSQRKTSLMLSAGHDPLAQLRTIELPEGASFCLRPTHLVGLLHDEARPIEITRHWRLFSLQAWLTLQLRYIVFHGPATLIVKGGRGVVVRDVENSGSVSMDLTMGFSGHIAYGTVRTETFWAYLLGKKGLLRDRFAGHGGICVFEEMAHADKRSGLTRKGLEGFFDAAMKVFGL